MPIVDVYTQQRLFPKTKIHHGQKHSIPSIRTANMNPQSNMKFEEFYATITRVSKAGQKILPTPNKNFKIKYLTEKKTTIKHYMHEHIPETGEAARPKPRRRRRICPIGRDGRGSRAGGTRRASPAPRASI